MSWLDPHTIISTAGVIGFGIVLFAETGLFLGVILPGDTLLFTAGVLAAKGYVSFPVLLVAGILAAFFGDQIGYIVGRHLGPKLFKKKDSTIFKRKHLHRAKKFFKAHGPKTVLIARFIPIFRSFTPTLAGAGAMKHKLFSLYNALGGILWVIGFSTLGYFLGNLIGFNTTILWYIIGGIVLISFGFGFFEFFVKRS